MNWKNAHIDGLPMHKEVVLISIDGISYLAECNKETGSFRVQGSSKYFWMKDHTIYWQPMSKTGR
jgi:hypothetical protein